MDFKAPTGKLAAPGLVNCACFLTKYRSLWFFVTGEKNMLSLFVCAAIIWTPSLSSRVEFMKPELVTSRNSDQVTLGLILVNINQTKTTSDMFQERLDPLVMSLAHQSTVPILLLIVTDSRTLEGNLDFS